MTRPRSAFVPWWQPWARCRAELSHPRGLMSAPGEVWACGLRRRHLGRHATTSGFGTVEFFDTRAEGRP